MVHDPSYHTLDTTFANQNEGLTTPTRNLGGLGSDGADVSRVAEQQTHVNTLVVVPWGLRIGNLDRADPPDYRPNAVPRGEAFNRNVFRITGAPRMPPIDVKCQVMGFDPATTPIQWRLQCRHVLGRYVNSGGFRYSSAVDILQDEWQGQSKAAEFKLFPETEDPNVTYTYNTSGADAPVMGGHAILSVHAQPPGAGIKLLDYVHLRIGGTNPVQTNVLAFMDTLLTGRDANIVRMVRAIFAHEANYAQFKSSAQTSIRMTFRQNFHQNNAAQPDCPVRFDFPDDPANFPNVAFDYGVGISQYTRVGGQQVSREMVWDWRENIKVGVNLFMEKLRSTRAGKTTWKQWALKAWERYNGSGAAAQAYAQSLSVSTDGAAVTNGALPASTTSESAALAGVTPRPAAPAWPPQ